ncbi:MAG: hypothetical protein SGPRY_002276 [Prymnesium sp.]
MSRLLAASNSKERAGPHEEHSDRCMSNGQLRSDIRYIRPSNQRGQRGYLVELPHDGEALNEVKIITSTKQSNLKRRDPNEWTTAEDVPQELWRAVRKGTRIFCPFDREPPDGQQLWLRIVAITKSEDGRQYLHRTEIREHKAHVKGAKAGPSSKPSDDVQPTEPAPLSASKKQKTCSLLSAQNSASCAKRSEPDERVEPEASDDVVPERGEPGEKPAKEKAKKDLIALPAPKQCEPPRLAQSVPGSPLLATDTVVTLQLKKPRSETKISCFEIELVDELAQNKISEKIADENIWSQAGTDGSFEYTLQQQLVMDRKYTVKVFAVGTGAKQKGMRSKPFSFSTPKPPPPPPERPAKPEAQVVEQKDLVLAFTLPSSVAPIQQFEALYCEDKLSCSPENWDEIDLPLPKDDGHVTFKSPLGGLEPGTCYLIKWRVRSEEWSAYSDELRVDTAQPVSTATPTAGTTPKKACPDVCKAPEQVSSSQEEVTIALTKPKSETAVQRFELQIRNGAMADFPKKWQTIEQTSLWDGIPADGTFTYTLNGLVPGATYFVKVRAVGTKEARRRNKWSEQARLVTTRESPPEAPAEPSCSEQKQNALQLVLTKPESVEQITALEIATQRVPMKDEEEPDWEYDLLGPDAVSWTLTDLLPGRRYRCMLRAKAAVWGPWSDVMEASTSTAVAPPAVLAEASFAAELEEEAEEAVQNHLAEAQRILRSLAQKDLTKSKQKEVSKPTRDMINRCTDSASAVRTAVLFEMVIKSKADGDLREGLRRALPGPLAAKSQAIQLAVAQLVPLFRCAPHAFRRLANSLDIGINIGLLDESPASCGISKEIGDACELAALLDELCGTADLQSRQTKFEQICAKLPDLDKRRALERHAEIASWVTGSVVFSSASGQLCEERDTKVFARCTKDILTCLHAVGKAICLEEKVKKRLMKRYGGSSQQKFQEEIHGLISSKPKQVFSELFWTDAVHSFEPKEMENWVDACIVAAERELLTSTQPLTHVVTHCCPRMWLPTRSLLVEKDVEMNPELLAAKARKFVMPSTDESSKAWQELSITKAYAKLNQEDAKDRWKGWSQGMQGFNAHARELMKKDDMPGQKSVCAPRSDTVVVQPYQESVSWLVHPLSLPNPRLLVVHRTGAGKTCSMIRICDNFFKDRRPKIAIFPTTAVCNNFYAELIDPKFPNRYAEYLARADKLTKVRKGLELTSGILRSGRVRPEYLYDSLRPSAPLRAFSYTQAGGQQSCGDRSQINPVFKCPDGYAGCWNYGPGEHHVTDGYADFVDKQDGNPFSNKIVLMDEVQNLLQPSAEIQKSKQRVLMLDKLKSMLATATNSVLVGFTATPLVGEEEEAKPLLDVIKGRGRESLLDEGFVSYFMSTPSAVFPLVSPSKVPTEVPTELLRSVELKNFPTVTVDDATKSKPAGNLAAYCKEASKGADDCKLSARCSLGQHFATAGRKDGAIRVLKGSEGALMKQPFSRDEKLDDSTDKVPEGFCRALARADPARRERLEGYASKLAAVCKDLETEQKSLVLVHNSHGHKLLLRLLHAKFGDKVLGYPKSRSVNKEDEEMLSLLGDSHNAKAKAEGLSCACNLCKFNDKLQNARGQCYRIMVADAKECSEGVSFFGVRHFLIVDVPSSASEYIQRVGRAIRFMGHAGLPKEERRVQIRLYQATLPRGEDGGSCDQPHQSRDEELIEKLQASVAAYHTKLRALEQEAFDAGVWLEAEEDVMEDIDLDANWDDELEETVCDEEASLIAPALAPELIPAPAPATSPPALSSVSFATSTYKRLYRSKEAHSVDELWAAVQAIVAAYTDGVSCSAVAQRFVNQLKMTYIAPGRQYKDETDANRLAVLLWSSTERSTDNRELCSYLNQCLREDKDPPLQHAVVRACPCHSLLPSHHACGASPQVVAEQLNKNLVNSFGHRSSFANHNKGYWPCGPEADLGNSTKANVTWRGTALPWAHLSFFSEGREFRTNMFLATSFDRDVAERFMMMQYLDNPQNGRALWEFEFEEKNCCHVNFIGEESVVRDEKEFLLTPYTALTVKKCYESSNLDVQPHRIIISVAPDNKQQPEDLPLAPWG